MSGYWPSIWPAEDGGPTRTQLVAGSLDARAGHLTATFRPLVATTMLVRRDPGELYVLAHGLGDDTVAWVEKIDPITLETTQRSPDLAAGPMWPGGLAVHADGHLVTVYGRFAHRLDPIDLTVVATYELPRDRPYNSFVILERGVIATKDFAKDGEQPSQLLALDPVTLAPIAEPLDLPERSIARLSASGDVVYLVGDAHLWRAEWSVDGWALDESFSPAYLGDTGATYGWDVVISAGFGWLLDNGEGSERYAGTMHGRGQNDAPLHLVRIDLETGAVRRAEVCGRPGGLVVNPPVVDIERGVVVGYDSGNGVIAGFDVDDLSLRWRHDQNHASHLLLYEGSGELVTHDHDAKRMADQLVVLDVATGEERARVDTGSPLQSVLFPTPGAQRDLYSAGFAGISRVAFGAE